MRAILFDLWETLVNDLPDRGRARALWRAANVRTVLQTAGHDPGFDPIDAALIRVSHRLTDMHDLGRDVDAVGRVELFAGELEEATGYRPPGEVFVELETAICTISPGLFPLAAADAPETLRQIKALGLSTGLISNAGTTTAPTLREMLEHYGLLQHLDVLVFSDEAMLAKPDPSIFQTAVQALGFPANDCVFVGDSPHNDVSGARAAGLHAVQIGSKQREGIVADARIDTLTELLPALAAKGLLTAPQA